MGVMKSTEQFVHEAIKVHGNKYCYDDVDYMGNKVKVHIKCLIHGEFWQMPDKHLSGQGCPKCGNKRIGKTLQSSTTEFIEKSIKLHGDKFDYSKVEYNGSHSKVCIICPEHGEFFQSPTNHLSGNGCLKCAWKYKHGKYRLTTLDTFLTQAKEIHGDKYNYSKVNWENTRTAITIICPIHGEFTQVPQNHIRLKCGCRKCGREITKSKVNKYDTVYFVKHAKKIHGNKYDYSNTECYNATDKVEIICPVHGKFKQMANQHLQGHACPKCNFDQMAKDRAMGEELFIDKAKKLFGEKYDYSKVKYINGQKKVCLICSIHGEFKVTPNSHLSRKSGCPICGESKLERELALILDKQNVKYERFKRFKWLGRQSLDFYLPEYHIAVECQGAQHFKPVDFAGKGKDWANKSFKENKKRDDLKLKKCLTNDIKMIYIIDDEEYFEKKYHFDVTEPFSENVSYEIIHINHFEIYTNRLVEIFHLLGEK
jgi:hypothetical protein